MPATISKAAACFTPQANVKAFIFRQNLLAYVEVMGLVF
jgi:hypothetical protein